MRWSKRTKLCDWSSKKAKALPHLLSCFRYPAAGRLKSLMPLVSKVLLADLNYSKFALTDVIKH